MKLPCQATLFLFALSLAACGDRFAFGNDAPSLAEADAAFAQHRVHDAARLYAAVEERGDDPKERADAALRGAMIHWRFFESWDDARAHLLDAAAAGVQASDLLSELAELETARGRPKAAREAALEALLLAGNESEARTARLRWATAALEEAKWQPNAATETSTAGAGGVRDALAVLEQLVEDEPGDLEPSRAWLQAALLGGDGSAALQAWRSYFRISPEGEVYDLLEEPWGELQAVLPDWRGADDGAPTLRLVRALGASRLYAEAALVASAPETAAAVRSEAADVLAYAQLIEALREATEEYYRRTALGEAAPEELYRLLLREALERWHALGIPGSPPDAEPESLDLEGLQAVLEEIAPTVEETLERRFGAYVNVGTTAGYLDLHMGHPVVDESRTVEQYGHSAEVRFVLLDTMVSNGFQSWAWNYESQHGGWAKPEAIYQVRAVYADGPVRAWRRLNDPHERQKWDAEIARQSAGESDRLQGDDVVYLPGLEGRLQRAALEELQARLRARGLTERELRTAFLSEFEAATQASSIFAHEGRHVIDKGLGIEGSPELEYRAKLSEIAFSALPRDVVARPILAPNLGDPTPHGQANERVIRGLVRWMEAHADEISGLDTEEPWLPQLDRLSPEQLRQAARWLDPLAR